MRTFACEFVRHLQAARSRLSPHASSFRGGPGERAEDAAVEAVLC